MKKQLKNEHIPFQGCVKARTTVLTVLSVIVLGCFSACGNSQDAEQVVEKHGVQVGHAKNIDLAGGRKLTDAAAHPTIPMTDGSAFEKSIPDNAQPFVGRYFTQISCQDKLVNCENGVADFIITLLPDGVAHRSIIHLGTIQFSSSRHYRQDSWSYDEEHHQIILHRASGVEFFYDIDLDGNMVMDLEKIANATEINRRYFKKGGDFPDQAYILAKKSETVGQVAAHQP